MCPTCGKGTLRIVDGSFVSAELKSSRDEHSHEAWDPEWIRYVYSCSLDCSNVKCKERVVSAGTGHVDSYAVVDDAGDVDLEYADFFRPQFFEPPLVIIPIPQACPDSVRTPLVESFRLFFCSPSAASNSIRVTVESLLTELHVKRYDVRGGRRVFLSLHHRISLLPSKYSDLKDMLLAIKWLGNAGSHETGAVTLDDVMDAYELIAHVLEELYMTKTKALKAMAKRINKKKGPGKPRVRRARASS